MTLERVQILLSREQRQKLKALARARGESVSEITRQTIAAGLEQFTQDEQQDQMQNALAAARRLRLSMPSLDINAAADLQQMREERDEHSTNRH